MSEAIFFGDAHASEAGRESIGTLKGFLAEVCPRARRVFLLGDIFDFWFGSKQARTPAYRDILETVSTLARSGTQVSFYKGNRDFYVNADLAEKYRFRLVSDYSIEQVCGRRLLLCHGDGLCVNDRSYHRMKAILRHPVTETIVQNLPSPVARTLALLYRAQSRRGVPSKPGWVVGINDDEVLRRFRLGADAVVCGHTHEERRRTFRTDGGPRELLTVGDFGRTGSYLECDDGRLTFKHWNPGGSSSGKGTASSRRSQKERTR